MRLQADSPQKLKEAVNDIVTRIEEKLQKMVSEDVKDKKLRNMILDDEYYSGLFKKNQDLVDVQ